MACDVVNRTPEAVALQEAAAATSAVESMHAERAPDASIGETGPTEIDYQAPDRVRTVASLEEGPIEMLYIGRDYYETAPNRPGFLRKVSLEDVGPDEHSPGTEFLLILRDIQRAPDVQRRGATFSFTYPAGAMSQKAGKGRATVEDGRITSFTVGVWQNGRVTISYKLSRFDASSPIEVPSKDRLDQDCPEDRSAWECVNVPGS